MAGRLSDYSARAAAVATERWPAWRAAWTAGARGLVAARRPVEGRLAVDRVDDARGLAELREPWDRLLTATGCRSPFRSWAWLEAWWSALGEGRRGALSTYVARDEAGRVAGILPAYRADAFGARVLRLLGDAVVGSEYLDALVEPSVPHACDALLAAAAADPELDGFELLDLDPDGALAAAWRDGRLAERGLAPGGLEHWQILPHVRLHGSWAALSQTMSSSQRYALGRKARRLAERHPRARLVVVADEAELPDALEGLFRLHAMRWRSRGQEGNFVDADTRAFHRRVAPRLLRAGVLRLYRLELEPGVAAATLYGLRFGRCEHYLQAGFDPAHEDVSVGVCLLRAVVEGAADAGLDEFDLLRGTEPYKAHWANGERHTLRARAARRTPRGLAWLAARAGGEALRDAAKAVLGPDDWATLRAGLSAVRARLPR
jgi:CelD/BcsL family acetyltransferase involved in cellulose biosynthesis